MMHQKPQARALPAPTVGIPQAILPDLRDHLAVFVKPEPVACVPRRQRRTAFTDHQWPSRPLRLRPLPPHRACRAWPCRRVHSRCRCILGAGIRPPPLHCRHRSVRVMIAPSPWRPTYLLRARGADQTITSAIDAHIAAEARRRRRRRGRAVGRACPCGLIAR